MSGRDIYCEDCVPALMDENVIAVKVFGLVKDQHIMGFGGPVSLNFSAVFDVMRMFEMSAKEQRACMGKVLKAYGLYLDKIRQKKES